jgi:hypothetical protein
MIRGRRLATLVTIALALGAAPAAASGAGGGDGGDPGHGSSDLVRYAADTWRSMVAMTDPQSGLPADVLNSDGSTSVQTSTTNIGAYLWSAYVAQRLGFITKREMVARMGTTLDTLEGMERHQPDGQFYNWYDHHTGAKLTTWPPTGEPLTPILSSVDNGWLASGLRVVAGGVPQLSARAKKLYNTMDFGFYYRPEVNRVLFHYAPDTGDAPCCYDTVVSESRIVDYLGIANGQLPQKEYFGRWRTFPDTCDYSFQETRPVGTTRNYFGVDVFEGAYDYAGVRVVPSWGGSMFEALMPSLFVPEERWGARSWGINHPLTVRGQIYHGMTEAGYGYWGFSPSNTPEGGYAAYGVDGMGMDPNGNPSNEDHTLIDHGFPGCPGRDAKPDPPQEAYTNGVVTPHAAFLALRYDPRAARDDLTRLAEDFPGLYGKWGFRDSVNVQTGHPSDAYLSLDQGMIMASLGNALARDAVRAAFDGSDMEHNVRPVLEAEEFGATATP